MNQKIGLWPYSTRAAILAIPTIWIFFIIIFFILQNYTNWLDAETRRLIMTVAIIVGFIPLGLVLLEFISIHGGLVDLKGILRIDFTQINLSQADTQRGPIKIPDNIGIYGVSISDTSPMKIISALKKATTNEIVLVDIKDGNTWWVTRLLALSAGAVRAGSPKAIVFLGKKENVDETFLGWAGSAEIQNAILDIDNNYRGIFQTSMRIAKQIEMFGRNELIPVSPPGFILNPEVTRYIYNPEYINLGNAAFEHILLDQMGHKGLEHPPDRLTLKRFTELLEPCINRNVIDLNWSNEIQISKLLNSNAPYIALLRDGKYVNMLKRDDGDRYIIRELFLQSQTIQTKVDSNKK